MTVQSYRSFFTRLFISPSEPRLRAGWRLLLHALLIEGIAIIVFLLYMAVINFLSLEIGDETINVAGLQLLIIALATWIARRYLDRRSFRSLGFKWDTLSLRDLAFGFFVPALLMGSIFALEWWVGWLRIERVMWKEPSPSTLISVLNVLVAFIAVGFYEELLFRGYRLQNLIEGLNLPWALVISSALFALAHLPNPHSSWASTLGLFAAGFFMAYGWIRTGRLWLSIGLHIGWNFFEGPIFGFPVSGLNFSQMIHQSNVGPVLITGGVFGPEAGLVILPAMAVGALMIWVYTGGNQARHRGSSPFVPREPAAGRCETA
ncbi:MAG TPA: CPBP family intramembrane metalloprotease [Anaerolineae bacterium]|nr:CPBP family intramembrane metalloprotease [Anaerolineae bacterium]